MFPELAPVFSGIRSVVGGKLSSEDPYAVS